MSVTVIASPLRLAGAGSPGRQAPVSFAAFAHRLLSEVAVFDRSLQEGPEVSARATRGGRRRLTRASLSSGRRLRDDIEWQDEQEAEQQCGAHAFITSQVAARYKRVM